MKQIAYTVYVASILLISGLTRANAATMNSTQGQYQTPATITQVAMDMKKLEILVGGTVPTPCYANPSAILTQSLENPTVLTLRMTSALPIDLCIEKVKYFATSLELPLLVRASQISIDDGLVYLVKVEGHEFQFQISGSDLKKAR